jgi:hypothetical protein
MLGGIFGNASAYFAGPDSISQLVLHILSEAGTFEQKCIFLH